MPSIFVDITTISPKGSGTSRYAKSLASELISREQLALHDYHDFNQKDKQLNGSKSPHRSINFYWLANRSNIQADAAIFPNYFMPFGWPYPSAVTIHDVSFLSHPHFYSRKMRLFYKSRIKHTIKEAKLILTVSEASKSSIIKYLGVKPDDILVHPPSPPLRPVKPVPRSQRPYLLYIGNLEPKKNIINLIQGFNRLANPEFKLLLAGKLHGPRNWNTKVVKLINSSPNVIWDGYVNDHTLNDYLAFASGLVLLSHIEGFGLPVLDALSMNIPVLVSDTPALKEVAGKHGIFSKPNITEDIVVGFEKLINRGREKGADTSIETRYGYSAYKNGVSEITSRLVKPEQFFFPSDLTNQYPSKGLETSVEQAMLGGIAYASVFKSGIHTDKLKYAMSFPVSDNGRFIHTLARLAARHQHELTVDGSTVYLNDVYNKQRELPESCRGLNENQIVRQSHQSVLRTILKIPFIKGLYYSGGTVHGSGLDSSADLDLLVISKSNCSWISYSLIRLISKLYGKSDSLCANYIIDEDSQHINWQQDYYTAFQLLFLKKIALKSDTEHIRKYNEWMYSYFPNQPRFESVSENKRARGNPLLSVLNISIMFIWSRVWKARGLESGSGGLLWDAYRIKLHTNDHRPKVSAHFREISRRLFSSISRDKVLKNKL